MTMIKNKIVTEIVKLPYERPARLAMGTIAALAHWRASTGEHGNEYQNDHERMYVVADGSAFSVMWEHE